MIYFHMNTSGNLIRFFERCRQKRSLNLKRCIDCWVEEEVKPMKMHKTWLINKEEIQKKFETTNFFPIWMIPPHYTPQKKNETWNPKIRSLLMFLFLWKGYIYNIFRCQPLIFRKGRSGKQAEKLRCQGSHRDATSRAPSNPWGIRPKETPFVTLNHKLLF